MSTANLNTASLNTGSLNIAGDQAAGLRAWADAERQRRHDATPVQPGRRKATVIAVTSGKGGVGKSNVSVNLAIRFAAAGKRVVLLDADLGLANADVLCNITLQYNLAHVIARRKQLAEVMVKGPGGFFLIGGASGLARMADITEADRRRILDAMAELERRVDVILIDTGAGINPNVLGFLNAADQVLIVTTPEPTAITDAYAVIKVMAKSHAGLPPEAVLRQRMSLLVNMARTPAEAEVVYRRVSDVARQFLQVNLADAGCVLADPAVSNAVRQRMPFMITQPRSAASLCIGRVAQRLADGVPSVDEIAGDGFFTRMGRWLRGGS